jgi:hypothetical protein
MDSVTCPHSSDYEHVLETGVNMLPTLLFASEVW